MQCCAYESRSSRGMRTYIEEPTLADALADPLVRAVMEADGVDPKTLETLFTSVARTL
jgi:hypothetical protein